MSRRLRVVYFGSGEFGAPTLRRIAADHDLALVVTQPDRPAGRTLGLTPTPIAALAAELSLPIIRPPTPDDAEVVRQIHDACADAFVVIAYGHKLKPDLLGDTFAINLHASLLPKYRGAAPINWAMINGETETGVSVITLAQTMDAGDVLAVRTTLIDSLETAGELHDRLALLGPELVNQVLAQSSENQLQPQSQDSSKATAAPKLTKADGTVRFDQPAVNVRQRVHGLTPWPGCTIRVNGQPLRLARVADQMNSDAAAAPGSLASDGSITCRIGSVRLLEVQAPGGRLMKFEEFTRGHRLAAGSMFEPMT